jgi:hypothetical protein
MPNRTYSVLYFIYFKLNFNSFLLKYMDMLTLIHIAFTLLQCTV